MPADQRPCGPRSGEYKWLAGWQCCWCVRDPRFVGEAAHLPGRPRKGEWRLRMVATCARKVLHQNKASRSGIMIQQLKSSLCKYQHFIWALVHVLTTPVLIQVPIVAWESSQEQPKALGTYPHVEDLEEAPISWLWIGSASDTTIIWRVNQRMEDLSLCELLFQIKINKSFLKIKYLFCRI